MSMTNKPKKVRLDRKKLWAICLKLTDHSYAARLLQLLGVFHASYKPLKHGWGSKWGYGYANTGEEWAERCGHSLRTHRRALKELLDAGLVETHAGKLGRDKQTWIRLTEQCSKYLFGDAIFDHDWHDQYGHSDAILDTQTEIKRCTSVKEQSGSTPPPAFSTTSMPASLEGETGEKEKKTHGKDGEKKVVTIRDVIQAAESKEDSAVNLETPPRARAGGARRRPPSDT